MRVKDLMHGADELPLVQTDLPMQEVLIEMTAKRFGCVGVVNSESVLQGIITDGDLRRHMGDDLLSQTAGGVMTQGAVTTTPKMLAAEALGIMNAKAITCLFALDEAQKPVGIIHIHDCLRAGVM